MAPEAVFDVGAFDLKNVLTIDPALLEEHQHEHDTSIRCFAVQMPGEVDPAALNGWLNRLVQDCGRDILRMKGIVNLAGEGRRFVFHGVHMTLEGRPGRPWRSGEMRSNAIVVIGRNLDEEMIRRGFIECLAPLMAIA